MGQLFGTDGFRGVAGRELTAELAFRTGQAATLVLTEDKRHKPLVIIGKDTRISSDMLEAALAAGITSMGGDVLSLGVAPTPAVAFETIRRGADAGVVISASHNSYEHNGIKLFDRSGFKLPDAVENSIEAHILSQEPLPQRSHGDIGRIRREKDPLSAYVAHLAAIADADLSHLHVVVDCANGASVSTAAALFAVLGVRADILHDRPDGININHLCGSTHLESLSATVRDGGYDIGLAFDGDADRLLAIDETGALIDGDHMLGACAMDEAARGYLPGNALVATVMSNLGLHKFCRDKKLALSCAGVGDRYVLEMMQQNGAQLGGEQSGHLIFLRHTSTGDGQLSAVKLLNVLARSGQKASALRQNIRLYPQMLKNITIPLDCKDRILQEARLVQEIAQTEAVLEGDGRVLVRLSGTEPLVRVMIEGPDPVLVSELVDRLVRCIESLVH